VSLRVALRDPWWLKELFTTKGHQGLHEGHQRSFCNTTGGCVQNSWHFVYCSPFSQ